MVKLNKIYTRTGDDGSTGLVGGGRVSKSSLRVTAYGEVDEANSVIGVAAVACAQSDRELVRAIERVLARIQHDMFDLGADLATPITGPEPPEKRLRVVASQTERLEGLIDEFNEPLASLTSFVLPGGSAEAAALHVARAVVRRAERQAVLLAEQEPAATNPEAIRYLNRLSDLLFVLARVANDGAGGDVLWVPGANRGG